MPLTLLGLFLIGGAFAAPAPTPSSAELGRQSLKFLEAASQAHNFELRALAATAWGLVGNPAAKPLLEKGLADRNAYVRIESATALQKLGFTDDAFAGLKTIVEAAPKDEKPTATSMMRDLARDKARILAIERLSDFGGEQAVKLFETTLKDPSNAVRDATAAALAKMGLDEFAQQFLDALKSKDEGVRLEAVRSLGLIGTPQALAALTSAADDRSPSVRVEAMRALGDFSGSDAAEPLAKGLNDSDDRVRARALASLSQLSDPDSAALLHNLEADKPTAENKLKIMAGLARRGEKIEYDVVNDALHEKDADLRGLALDVLRPIDDDGVLPILDDVMNSDPDPRLRVQAAGLILKRVQRRHS